MEEILTEWCYFVQFVSYFLILKEDSKVLQIILINQPGNLNVLRAGKWHLFHLQNAINFKNFHLKLMSQSQKCKTIHIVYFLGELNVLIFVRQSVMMFL